MNTRTEFWLQRKGNDGLWRDCGSALSAAHIWKNIEDLKLSDPDSEWKCIERAIIERDISEQEANETVEGK